MKYFWIIKTENSDALLIKNNSQIVIHISIINSSDMVLISLLSKLLKIINYSKLNSSFVSMKIVINLAMFKITILKEIQTLVIFNKFYLTSIASLLISTHYIFWIMKILYKYILRVFQFITVVMQ